jgi:RNA polymerase sigma factor (sigma-70 family)
MNDFNIQIKVRNARLLRAIRSVSDSAADFSRLSGVSQTVISALLTMKLSPMRKDGTWTVPATEIASYVGMTPEEIWPAHMERLLLKRAEAEIEFSAADVLAIAGDGENATIQRQLLERWAAALTPKQIEIIGRRNAGETYEEISKDFGVTRERIRQQEFRAIYKMRKAARVDGIESMTQVLS